MKIVSEQCKKNDGIYFDVKIYAIIEPLQISARELAEKYIDKFSNHDKKLILNAYKFDFRYRLAYSTDEEFMLYDLLSGEDIWIELNYRTLKKFPDGALSKNDIIKITQRIEHETIEMNDTNYSIYNSCRKKDVEETTLTLIK